MSVDEGKLKEFNADPRRCAYEMNLREIRGQRESMLTLLRPGAKLQAGVV
jgi:hypothetical protein